MKRDRLSTARMGLRWIAAGMIALWGASNALSAGEATEELLPTGKAVVERYLEALGGREALEKIENRVLKAELSMEQMGIKGTTVITQARPNLYHARAEIPGLMTVENASNGELAWEASSITGPRIVEGEERGMMLWMQRFDDTTYEEDMESVECTGVEDVDGKACYKVVMTPKGSRAFSMYFSKESGLPVKVVLVFAHMFGDVEVQSRISDYREVDGVLYPHSSTESVMGTEMKTTITEIKHNVEIPAERFKMPEEVKKLLERAAAKKETDVAGGEEKEDTAGRQGAE